MRLTYLICTFFYVGRLRPAPGTWGSLAALVIDEVAGQWLAFLPVSIGASHAGADLLNLWPGFVFSFAAFRFFDITKLGPIGWADRRNDALGVMLDDIVAGFAAALCVLLAAGLYHGVLGL